MKIEIAKISEDGSYYEGETPGAILADSGEPLIRPESDISYRFFIQYVSERIIVSGSLKTQVGLECSRCGQFFSTTVADSSFLRDYELPGLGEELDMSEGIREDLLLQIPAFSVCDPGCKGLCPQCGTNLNQSACQCSPPSVDSRWDDLNGINL